MMCGIGRKEHESECHNRKIERNSSSTKSEKKRKPKLQINKIQRKKYIS